MKAINRILLSLVLLLVFAASGIAAQPEVPLAFADLGDFRLEGGQVIRNCRVGYRTAGVLNKEKSNVILFPTWLAGTSKDLFDLGFIGPGKLADTSKYFVIAVDAFGNGVSSSPSNSTTQSASAFPEFTIGDMINAQYIILKKHLNLDRLYAVMGISMGGMQAFQWLLTYPEFMKNAVSIMGTPSATSCDLLVWQAELRAIEATRGVQEGDARRMERLVPIHTLATRTPQYYVSHITPEGLPQFLAETEKALAKYNPNDWAWQLKAIMSGDLYRSFGKSAERAAGVVKAKLFVIVAQNDHMVNPEPSVAFAGILKAKTLELSSDCGHFAFFCEQEKIREAVASFLAN